MKFKIIVLSLFSVLLLIGCKSSQKSPNTFELNMVAGKKNTKHFKVSKDSLFVVSPYVECGANGKAIDKNDKQLKRVKIGNEIGNALKKELGKDTVYDLPLVYQDFRSVNTVLERLQYDSFINTKVVYKAPPEIVVPNQKYTVLLYYICNGINPDSGKMRVSIINNEEKIIECTDDFDIKFNPLNKTKLEASIKSILAKRTF